jgi:4-hydroxyphenylpyruvate dioxygenase-like putative hemolysin
MCMPVLLGMRIDRCLPAIHFHSNSIGNARGACTLSEHAQSHPPGSRAVTSHVADRTLAHAEAMAHHLIKGNISCSNVFLRRAL